MSKESAANEALKNTTPANTSTTNSTSTEAKTDNTTQAAGSNSSPTGIIEEATSTEVPTEVVPPVVEAAKPAEEVPAAIEPYDLELDEDSPLSDEEFDEVVLEAERLKLNKDDAEKLIKMRESSHKASGQIIEKALEKRTEDMVTAYKSEASLHTVEAKLSMRESIKAFGNTPEFKEMFKDPSMNFNIPLAKFLISVGDKIRGGTNNLPMAKGGSVVPNDDVNKVANNFYKDM